MGCWGFSPQKQILIIRRIAAGPKVVPKPGSLRLGRHLLQQLAVRKELTSRTNVFLRKRARGKAKRKSELDVLGGQVILHSLSK